MDIRTVYRLLILVLLFALMLSACSGLPSPEPTPTETVRETEIPDNTPDLTKIAEQEPAIQAESTPTQLTTSTPKATPTVEMIQATITPAAEVTEKLRCFSFAAWWHDELEKPRTLESLQALANTGANCIVLPVTIYQEDVNSTVIFATNNTVSDKGLIIIAGEAANLGLKVILKPHVSNLSNRWSANIGRDTTVFGNEEKEEWFKNYSILSLHYARLAEENGMEGFSVGNELGGLSVHENEWRMLVSEIRNVYSGWLTYAATTEEVDHIAWWDAIDMVGLNAYYPLSIGPEIEKEEMTARFAAVTKTIENIATRTQRPVLITEIGFKSVRGSASNPAIYEHVDVIDLEEQRMAYEVVLEGLTSLETSPSYAGVAFWFWDPRPDRKGPEDPDYLIWGKPAEVVVTNYWSR